MKSLLYTFLFLLSTFFLGCNKPQPKENIWIEAYSHQNNGVVMSPSGHKILDLLEDKALLINFNSGANSSIPLTKTDTLKFDASNQTVIYKGKATKVNITKDTLKLELENSQLVFYKLKQQWKTTSEINLVKKEVSIKNKFNSCNYEFVNDSMLIQFRSNESDERYPFKKWSIREYKGYKFFVVHSIFYAQSIITSNNFSLLIPYQDGFIKETATFIPTTKTKISISGKWKGIKTIQISIYPNNNDTILTPNLAPAPPPPPSVEPVDYENFILNIKSDSVLINRYGRKYKQAWQLSSNNKRLFLSKNYKKDGIFFNSWQILGITDTTMTLKMNSLGSSTLKDIVTFKKLN
jgi:hypothetical protein